MKHILLIEDDTWQAEHTQKILERAGFAVTHAPDAITALDQIDDRRPDCLVLDMFLPGPNALTLLHEMQSHDDLAGIPVVLVSTHVQQTLESLRPYGVVALLDKTTITASRLVETVQRALS